MADRLKDFFYFLALASICVSLLACVPSLRDVKTDAPPETQQRNDSENKKQEGADKPVELQSESSKKTETDDLKNKIRDDWHAGKLAQKDKNSGTGSKQTLKKSEKSSHNIAGESKKPHEKQLSEEERIMIAAMETVKSLSSPHKYMVCFDEEKTEWWLTIYDDIGYAFDVKQFFWNPELDRFEPFLVLNKISKSRLNAEIAKKSAAKKCTVHDVKPPDKSKPAD